MPRRNPNLQGALATLWLIAERQAGVVTSQQARAAGVPPDAVRRRVATGRWAHLHRGVYLTNAGPPMLVARMWAAALVIGSPAVVSGRAAGHYWSLLDGDLPAGEPVLILVSEPVHARTPGIRTRRIPDPLCRAHPARMPLVVDVENAVLDLMAVAATEGAAVEIILRACRQRQTTPGRILAAAGQRARLRGRDLVREVCGEGVLGITSPLERAYRRRVSMPHGLPVAQGQVRAELAGRVVYRDLLYREQGVIVELDGRRGHAGEAGAFRDQERDNGAALTGQASLRYGWVAVVGAPCDVAIQVGAMLRVRGWKGRVRPCGPRCPATAPGVG